MSTPAEPSAPRPPGTAASSTTSATGTTTAPRLGRGATSRARCSCESAKGAYGLGRSAKSKVMPMLLLAAICLPAFIIAVIAAVTNDDKLPGDYTSYVAEPAARWSMVFVAGAGAGDASRATCGSGSMSLYFSRPLERIDYVWPSTPAHDRGALHADGAAADDPVRRRAAGQAAAGRAGAGLPAVARRRAPVRSGARRDRPGHRRVHAAPRPRGRGHHRGAGRRSPACRAPCRASRSTRTRTPSPATPGCSRRSPWWTACRPRLLGADEPLPAEPPGTLGGAVFAARRRRAWSPACFGALLAPLPEGVDLMSDAAAGQGVPLVRQRRRRQRRDDDDRPRRDRPARPERRRQVDADPHDGRLPARRRPAA